MRLPLATSLLLSLAVGTAINTQIVAEARCVRRPTDTEADRTVGTNGFHLKILSYPKNESAPVPEGYIPGETYTVVLEGWKAQYTVQTFRGFSLVAIQEGSDDFEQSVGKFRVGDNPNLKSSPDCWHGITHTSRHPKTEIEAVWQAPTTNRGCVEFRAMVLEYQDIWYMDEGPLTKKFCQLIGLESAAPSVPELECCACDEAKYELVFEGIWSKQTHPKDFPTIEHLTHFSDLIGASHSSKYSEWAFGSYASDGLKELAEWGNTHKMEQEMKKKAKEIRTIIKARGLWYPHVQGTTRAVFRTDRYHHLLSLASMLGPSPDWVTGISAVNLCLSNCSWVTERHFDLLPWDAGTDSGTTYMSPNRPTLPREPITEITNRQPTTSPFFDPNVDSIPPLAKLIIRRQQVYDMECRNSTSNYQSASGADAEPSTSEDLEHTPGCEAGSWTPWSECSATCGKGISMRSRVYQNPVKAQMMSCKRQMVGKKFCNAEISECQDSQNFNDICSVSEWNEWTECSVTCDKGLRSRTRQYDNPMAMKKCSLELMEKEMCIGPGGMDCNVTPDPRCRATYWSEWSPCSVTCGQGLKVRTRLLYYPENEEECRHQSLMEKGVCTAELSNCDTVLHQHREEICVEPLVNGQCSGVFPRYYYDAERNDCLRFIYTGCKGNRNNFQSQEECLRTCRNRNGDNLLAPMPPKMPTKPGMDSYNPYINDGNSDNRGLLLKPKFRPISEPTNLSQDQSKMALMNRLAAALNLHSIDSYLNLATGFVCVPANQLAVALGVQSEDSTPVDCMLMDWSPWSECSRSCGKGKKQRSRIVKVESRNGGLPCPDHLTEKMKCSLRPCPLDCKLTVWSPWSTCSVTCGSGVRMRQRRVQSAPRRGGSECTADMLEKEICRIPC